jgi:hypothetical protein
VEYSTANGKVSEAPFDKLDPWRLSRLCCAVLLSLVTLIPAMSRAQMPPKSRSIQAVPKPESAIPAVLAAFEKYEVVAMSEAHGQKDMDDFIFSLIRTPRFSDKVNDIEVECGNSLYQDVLDRYIAGEDVPFIEVRQVWRNTTQQMCGTSGFFEQFFPLVRAINQKLPAGKRLRVLAGDPPIDWAQVKTADDASKFLSGREKSIVSVMEQHILSKHRKALILFGSLHLMHNSDNAVSMYEKDYPNVTFVVFDLGTFDSDLPALTGTTLETWPIPSLIGAKGTKLGALDIGHFIPPPIMIDQDCKVSREYPKEMQKPMSDLVDAFLYLGPGALRLKEPMPADIALDVDYMKELQRRAAFAGMSGVSISTQIVKSAEHPVFSATESPDLKAMAKNCLDRKSRIAPH